MLWKSIVSESFAFIISQACTCCSKGSRIRFPFHIPKKIPIIWRRVNFTIFTSDHLGEKDCEQRKIHLNKKLLKSYLSKINVFYTFCNIFWFNARKKEIRKYDKNWNTIERFWSIGFVTYFVPYSKPIYIWFTTRYIYALSSWQSYLGRELSTIVCCYWRFQETNLKVLHRLFKIGRSQAFLWNWVTYGKTYRAYQGDPDHLKIVLLVDICESAEIWKFQKRLTDKKQFFKMTTQFVRLKFWIKYCSSKVLYWPQRIYDSYKMGLFVLH